MTPEEISICRALAEALLDNLLSTPISAILFCPLTIMFLYGVCADSKGTVKRGLMVIATLCFLLANAEAITRITFHWIVATGLNIKDVADPLVERRGLIRVALLPWESARRTAYRAMFLVTDTVFVWRACTLHGWRRTVVIPLMILLGVYSVTSLWYLIEWGLQSYKVGRQAPDTDRLAVMEVIYQTTSIIVNLSATCLIGYTLLQHKRRLKVLGQRIGQPFKILFLIVESGIFFCLFQILDRTLSSLGGLDTPLQYQIRYLYNLLDFIEMIMLVYMAIYPICVIFIVRYPSWSMIETCISDHQATEG